MGQVVFPQLNGLFPQLTQQRRSIIRPMDGTRGHSVEDDWTTKSRFLNSMGCFIVVSLAFH